MVSSWWPATPFTYCEGTGWGRCERIRRIRRCRSTTVGAEILLSADYSSFGRGDTHHHLLGARGLAVNRGLAVARLRVSILRCLLGLDPVGLSGILAHAVRGSPH